MRARSSALPAPRPEHQVCGKISCQSDDRDRDNQWQQEQKAGSWAGIPIFERHLSEARGCFKVRIDRIRPNGSDRTRITNGGPSCTPAGLQQSGDADPAVSPDGKTIYSSRGLPLTVPGFRA
jgi:hypothetical protein